MGVLMSNYIEREEFDKTTNNLIDSIKRIHERVDEMRESQIRIESYTKIIKDNSNKIYEVMYGKDMDGGIVTRVSSLLTQATIQWSIIVIILTGLIGLVVWRFR
jgi:hypothetical protein